MRLQFILSLSLVGAVTNACGDKEEKTEAPAAVSAALSQNYADNCASCHGADGSMAASGKALKGTALTEAAFISKVRNGVAGTTMTSFAAAVYSDANLKADFAILD